MNSGQNDYKLLKSTDQKKISRRTFFTKSVGCTAGLALMTFPGIITETLATKKDQSKEEIFKELEEKAG